MTAEQELAAYEITVDSIRDERLREITRQLVDADRKIPENLTVEEMGYFLEHAEENVQTIILAKLHRNAVPVPMD